MSGDHQLLRRYADEGSEAAFAELVSKYVNLVYSAALRRAGGDTHLAQDVAQLVFADLARKAGSLSPEVVLAGWLHRATRFAVAQVIRSERRRQCREQEAVAMNTSESGSDWEQIRPLLDEALDELSAADRDALILRFMEQRSFSEVGRALGSNEEATRKRVSRALEKLRELMVRRGVTTTAAALSTAVTVNAVETVPAGLAATLTTASLASAGTGTATTLTALKFMAATKLKLGLSVFAIASAATVLLMEHQSKVTMRKENDSLRQKMAQLQTENENLSNHIAQARRARVPRLPAPRLQAAGPREATVKELRSTNLYARLKENSGKLTAAQIEPYLRANHRSASSLLAAYRTSGDPALLDEAMQRYPDDPQVAFEAAFKKDASPEQRRHWIEAFKKSGAESALPNYLSALDYFKAGQVDQAVQELIAASGKNLFQDYTLDRMQNDEDAYLEAGYPTAEAKTIPAWQLLLPQLSQLKDLSQQMIDLASSYRQAGDEASAQAALQMAANLGQRYGNTIVGETEISRLVGLAIERNALKSMDPNSSYNDSGQTVQERLDYLAQQRTELKNIADQTEALLPMMSDQDWISYKDRWRIFGEEAAAKWLINKYGQK